MQLVIGFPGSAPDLHRAFVTRAVPILQGDPRIVGVGAAGSWADDTMDVHSDLDLVIAVEPQSFETVLTDRPRIAASLGQLVAAFTGDHVGEPRVLICLYDAPLLHVDLKFVAIDQVGTTVDRPVVLSECAGGEFSNALERSYTGYPRPDPAWIEARFWTWIHYGASKVARGELYEALDLLAFLRARVLGPLILERVGERPAGVRRLERSAPEWAARLHATVPPHDPRACLEALARCAEIYRDVRPAPTAATSRAETVAMSHLQDVAGRL